MRILITSDIFPPDVGGPATYVPRIATELTRRGHQVTVVTYSLVPCHAGDSGYPFPVVRVSAAPPRWRRLPRTLAAIQDHGRQVDIIYANGLVTETVLANYVLRRPVVAKVVGDLAWERSRDKGWIQDSIELFQTKRYSSRVELMRWRRNWSYARMDGIIVPSRYLKRMLVEHWHRPAGRVQVVYNSFEAQERQMPPAAIDLPVKYKLITVCRLTGWKGVDGLIRALPALPDVGLVVVGDGPLYAELVALAQALDVATRVRFVGTVPGEQVPAYLRACDIFVLHSTYEGLPHVLLEAAAAGLPVIATAVGGTPEVLQDGPLAGQLVPPGDPDALKEAILSWIGRLPVPPSSLPLRFSLPHMVQATEDVLQQALHQAGH
jgi:glycosyltransferase involved in cell wall biosynthesis